MIRDHQLDSGLRLVTEQMDDARSVCIGFWVGTGSRDESDEQAGASHFLEHLLFKGTATRTAAAIAEAVDEVGGDFNAYTTKEYTSFYIRLLSEHLPLGLDILSDIMWRPALRPDDVDAERQVILDEILMHADEPADLAAEQSASAVFPEHPLGRDVLGTATSVAALTPDEIRAFFGEHYRPGNMVVAVAGDLEDDVVVRGLDERFSGRTGGTAPGRQPPADDVEALRVTRRSTEQAHVVVTARSSDRFDKRRYALAMLNHTLGGGLSSRLFQEIRERRGLAYSVWSERIAYGDAGMVSIGLGTAPEHVSEALTIVTDALGDLGAHGITERELRVAAGNLRADMLLASEDSGARMGRIGAAQLLYHEVLPVDEVLARIEAVTIDDVRAVAAELAAAPRTLSVVGPFDPSDFDVDALSLG
jgi:predicted Zn-dependent peptidase